MVTTYEAGNYDVVVVGAGHAGSEAALASARMGRKNIITDNEFRNGGLHAM